MTNRISNIAIILLTALALAGFAWVQITKHNHSTEMKHYTKEVNRISGRVRELAIRADALASQLDSCKAFVPEPQVIIKTVIKKVPLNWWVAEQQDTLRDTIMGWFGEPIDTLRGN